MIPGDLLSACPHRQLHRLPSLLDSWAALSNSNPNACMPMQGGSLYHFYDGLWYDPVERRTHDLLCERRTRYRLSQPNTVNNEQQCDVLCCIEQWMSRVNGYIFWIAIQIAIHIEIQIIFARSPTYGETTKHGGIIYLSNMACRMSLLWAEQMDVISVWVSCSNWWLILLSSDELSICQVKIR